MKVIYVKWGNVIAELALFVTKRMVNVSCASTFYQPKTTADMKKLRKF